jgi:hypothetical protein
MVTLLPELLSVTEILLTLGFEPSVTGTFSVWPYALTTPAGRSAVASRFSCQYGVNNSAPSNEY